MEKEPKISVIIPIYNQEQYLYNCLESVLLQNLQEIEVICVNDGSTDKSFDILSELAWSDDRLRIINQENKGVGEARNTGIREARGEYIAFIDPDDQYYNFKALETLYGFANQNEADICGGCFTKQIEGQGEQDVFSGSEARYAFDEDRFYSYKEYQYDFGFHRFIYSSKFIMENKLFFPSLKRFQDPLWFVEVMHKAGRFFGVSEKVYLYRKGHKEKTFDKEKVCHIITGITEVAKIAVENNYDHLVALERMRLIRDYAEDIYLYLCDGDEDILRLLYSFVEVTGFKNIEKEILVNVLKKRDKQLEVREEELEKQLESAERFRMENGALKRLADDNQAELEQINANLGAVLKELEIRGKKAVKKDSCNILNYPYVHKTLEKKGIKWTDLGDGRIEATGKAEADTTFNLTAAVNNSNLKTGNKRFKVSTGATNTSSFTWYISGRVGNKGEEKKAILLKDVVINNTDGFADSFEIDTSGYDCFLKLYLVVKKGRTLDHVIFKPELRPID